MKEVFIIGSKGIPANYGGFETFVDELISRKKNKFIKYHVACMNHRQDVLYHDARCFGVKVPNIGSAKALYYDIAALRKVVDYIKKHHLKNGIVYVLACRIGPFFKHYVKMLHKSGFQVFVNPDGHEWKRSKWNALIKLYWKYSEKLMVQNADLLVCDSLTIEKYIQSFYSVYSPNTKFIAYGADAMKSDLKNHDKILLDWYQKFSIQSGQYYLIIGRFVPENNYEIIIREFMQSNSKKDLVIVTNVSKNNFFETLRKKTKFEEDKRIKFVGTVYEKQLIKKIRENAYGYFHGHEVGGTNPSLLEALASTKLNLLFDVGFNKEVAKDGALYWNKEIGNLANLINKVEMMDDKQITELSKKAKARINDNYSWDFIVEEYEQLFCVEVSK